MTRNHSTAQHEVITRNSRQYPAYRRFVTILADRASMTGVTSDDRLVCFSDQQWRWLYEDGKPVDRPVIVTWLDEDEE